MASLTQWTWVWVDSGCWWWTGRLACCSSWGCKESDTTERLNWTELSASMVSQTVNNLSLPCGRPGFNPWVGKILWRKKWKATPVLLPGEFDGQRSLASYCPWGHTELDMTEWLAQLFRIKILEHVENYHPGVIFKLYPVKQIFVVFQENLINCI